MASASGVLIKLWLLLALIWCKNLWGLPTPSNNSDMSLQDVWMPNLRGLPLGRTGEIVAEFEVASSPIKSEDDDYEDIYQRIGQKVDDYKPCLDPESRITLFPLDNFKWNENQFQRPLTLRTEARRLSSGRFATRNNGADSYQSVKIEGRCCWEAFTRTAFQGRKLRLCRGKYKANILGSLANNIQSIRPVEHFF